MNQAPSDNEHEITAVDAKTFQRPKYERPRTSYAFEVRVVDGQDFGYVVTLEAAGTSFALVGRSSTCAVRLSDERVGARQCSLQVVGARLQIIDLSEPRSTKVNGTLVFEAWLVGGETIRIGDTALAINRIEQRRDASRASSFGRLRGESSAMRELYPLVEAATHSLNPVLIHGERGSGKRLLAEELHRLTRRSGDGVPGLFVSLATGGTSDGAEPTAAASLFGDGGLIEQAGGGTLYIGDVAALDDATQDRLAETLGARALVEGADTKDSRRIRLILGWRGPAATALAPSLMRYFTAHAGVRLALPPLRAREADLVFLSRQFWSELGGEGCLPDDFAMHFQGHAWSGNVRELRVVVESWIQHGASASSSHDIVAFSSASPNDPLSRVLESDLPFARARKQIVAEFERRYVARALTRANHKISRAAAASGIAHRYFQVLKARCSA